MTNEEIKMILLKNGINIANEETKGDNTILRFQDCIITCYKNGNHQCQGKRGAEIKTLLENAMKPNFHNRTDVFVVYGHDQTARTELEAMLRRWDLKPIILDQLESKGLTIIEKLEEYMQSVQYGIVLATPDDIGYAKDHEDAKKYRVRQNVVLEMGMLLAKIGRERVAILVKNTEDMEKPSDIHGLVYIPFRNNVEETKVNLAKEMNTHGYNIGIDKL